MPLEDSEKSLRVRGQFANYARAICANSHRSHLIAFIILPNMARLLRFDNGGTIYSELFAWKNTSHLAQLFQRIAAAPDAERGFDTSATRISPKDELIVTAKRIFNEARAADELPDDATWDSIFNPGPPLSEVYWLFEVYDEQQRSFHRVLTGYPHTATPYLIGRATRGYIAIDLDKRAVVYMKRSWRIDLPGIPKERNVYQEFEDAEIRHLPGCYFGGDVPAKSGTLAIHYHSWKDSTASNARWDPPISTDALCSQSSEVVFTHNLRRGKTDWNPEPKGPEIIEIQPHVLHVTLFLKVGGSLTEFSKSHDLCTALRDALESTQVDVSYLSFMF